jgi:hypothetical protein
MGKRVLRIAVGAAALLVSSVWAQQNVGIGTNTPHPTALLELYSTSKGLLIPRMTQAERDAISSPATGLLIYQTDNTPGFYYWNGTAWIPLLSSSSGSGLFWSLTGNSITGTEFLTPSGCALRRGGMWALGRRRRHCAWRLWMRG